jgi:bifunctional non-homologous end joining protein LigD
MSLDEYKRKRKFSQTPEPPAELAEPVKGAKARRPAQYFIQRHDATRLHYDFRLEVDGALKSWAVPKGPSLDPSQKRLAVEVEDHPMEYGTFEGNIPKGNYGGGSVMLWDRGTFTPVGSVPAGEQIAHGELKFELDGEKLHGGFALVRMKGAKNKKNQWLLIKHRDESADENWKIETADRSVASNRSQGEIAAPPKPIEPNIEPMKAMLAEAPPAGKGWLYEIKWDGVRALGYVRNRAAEFYSRKGERVTSQYPELAGLAKFLRAESAIVDGEIAAVDEKGRPHFQLLQPRIMASSKAAIAEAAANTPVTYYVFDLLEHNGIDLRNKPLIERKKLLKSILSNDERFRYSEHFEDRGEELLAQAREAGLEGIMAKRADSRYESKRSSAWLKIKLVQQQEFVICGYTKGERETFASLMLGVFHKGKLEYCGNVGTGFNEESLNAIHKKLQPLIVPKSPFSNLKLPANKRVTWVKPELVCEVKFSQWTNDWHLRAPVFLGLRPDVSAQDCVREAVHEPVKTTNLAKVFYPKHNYTKGDVLAYYEGVAGLLLPHLQNRPLALKRYPSGVEGKFFFQKHPTAGFPDFLKAQGEHPGDPEFIVCNDRESLLYLVNLGCIDQNPWMSRLGSLDNPDYIVLDLDANECPYSMVVRAAQAVRKILDVLELRSYPKTTGGDGMHIYIPIAPRYTYAQARCFAEILSLLAAQHNPEMFTVPRSVASRRKGRVYFDYMQIGKGKTISAPYVLRAHPDALVATPLDWKEVTAKLSPAKFHLGNALKRFESGNDLFRDVLTNKQALDKPLFKLRALLED